MGNNDFKIILQALLDETSLSDIEKKLAKKKINLGLDFDFAKSLNESEKQVKELSKRFKEMFNFKTDSEALSFTKKYLTESNKLIAQNEKLQEKSNAEMQKALEKTEQLRKEEEQRQAKAQNDAINKNLEKEYQEREKLTEAMARGREQSELARQAEEKRQQTIQNNAINKSLDEQYAKVQKINEALANGQISKDLNGKSGVSTLYNGLNTATTSTVIPESLKTDYQSLITLSEKLNTSLSDKEKNATWLEYQNTLKSVKSQLSVVSTTTQQLATEQSRLSQAGEMSKWLHNNSKATKMFGSQINEMITKLRSVDDLTVPELEKIRAEFQKIQISAREANKIGFSFGDKLKNTWEKFGGWSFVTGAMVQGFQQIKEGTRFIGELDDAMTDVAYTSDITAKGLADLGNSSIDMAKELNTSATNVLEAVKIYSTAKSSAEDILRKSQPAIMLSNTSGMSGAESSKTINTVLNQFDVDDTEEGLLDIVDTLEYVSSQLNYDFSEGIQEITEGVEASGSVAKNAGLDFQEYASMVGLAVEKTGQSGSTIGQAYKTIFSRITKASATEGTLDEDISAAEESLRSVGVEVRDTQDEFRDLTDIMADLGKVWDSLSSVEKSNIGFNVAGTRQLNVVNSLLGSWTEYEDIMGSIDERTGMTMQNQETYADSLKGHLGDLEATGQSIWNNILNSDELKGGVDLLTGLLTVVDKLTSAIGGLGTAGLALGAGLSLKNVGVA